VVQISTAFPTDFFTLLKTEFLGFPVVKTPSLEVQSFQHNIMCDRQTDKHHTTAHATLYTASHG